MKNQYFKKDKKAMLVSKGYMTTSGFQVSTYRYLTKEPVWVYTKQLSQAQTFEAHSYGNDETRLFVLNHRKDLKLYDLIEYNSKYYSITRLDTTDDYNGELFVYVKDATKGDTPTTITTP